MSIVVDVTDDDSQRVRTAHRRTTAIAYDNRQMVLLALFSVERLQTGDHTRPISIVTATFVTTNSSDSVKTPPSCCVGTSGCAQITLAWVGTQVRGKNDQKKPIQDKVLKVNRAQSTYIP
jgi:hypothetical protein